MPKRERDDDDSLSLIDEMRAQDEIEAIAMHSSNERATIEALHKERLSVIEDEFKTLDPETLSGRDSLRLQQKLDFEEGLYQDKLKKNNEEMECDIAHVSVNKAKRKKMRFIDAQLKSARKIADEKMPDASWHLIGKNRHVQCQLSDLTTGMSSEQKKVYKELMVDLKKNGWKIFKKD